MTAGSHYDRLELRSPDERARELARDLPALVARARDLAPGYAGMLADIDPAEFTSVDDLARLPVPAQGGACPVAVGSTAIWRTCCPRDS